jgi:hypothetical protein
LPLKVALNSEVVENTPEQYFKTDIDAFPGNSGGPVFDPNGFIEGILVRGAVEYANGSYTGDYKYDADCDCVKTVTFRNTDSNAGCEIQKINKIPFDVLETIIYENLVHSITNFDFDEFERWSVYEWMVPSEEQLAQESFEALIIRTDVGQGLATGKNYIMTDLISRNSGKYKESFEHDLVTYNLNAYSRDLRDATAEYLNLDARSTEGRTPLMDQAIYGDWGTADELLDYGANPALKDASGNTALHLSIQSRNAEVVELFASRMKDPNSFNNDGDTALHLTAQKGSMDMVVSLIENGANPKLKNNDGYYPEKVAKKSGYKSLSKYLKKERKKR